MNKITLGELANITPILAVNKLNSNELFDYIRVVSIGKTKYEEIANNPLYFIIYTEEKEASNGWYVKPVDLRPYMNKIMKEHPNYTFVIEESMVANLDNNENRLIVVKNIQDTLNDLFNYYLNKSKAKTVAITGSVGKTTCVGLIENILKKKYNVLRIYSKRITPLVLKANIINLLDDSIDYIVTENSIYYHDHVKILSDLLKPEIAGILNIESSHLGVDGLHTIDDICKYKSFIFEHAKKGYVTYPDSYLDKLNLSDGKLTYEGEELLTNYNLELEKVNANEIKVENNQFIIDDIKVNPFILSSLSKIQFGLAYKISKLLGIKKEDIEEGMNTYEPVENRLQTEVFHGKRFIFDGDITTYERIKELSDSMYEDKYLILRKVGSAENTYRIADIKRHFDKYKKVYVFNDVEYLDEFIDCPNVEVVSDHSFMNDLNGTIIYHYSGYYRVWNKYDENNLNIYDKDVYPIMREKKR